MANIIQFPKIKPGTYNGKPTYKQYSIKIEIPLVEYVVNTSDIKNQNEISKIELAAKSEIDSVNNGIVPFEEKTFSSQLNIPFTHFDYSKFDRNMNLVGANSHTASKPFLYEEVSTYYDFKAENEKLQKSTNTWVAKIADVLGVIAASIFRGSIVQYTGSISTKTGLHDSQTIDDVVAI